MVDRSRVAALAGCVALLTAGCANPQPDEATETLPAVPSGVVPSGAADESDPGSGEVAPAGATADIPAEVILEELRLAAERIAQEMPSAAPTLTPDDVDPGSNRGLGFRLMLGFGFAEVQWTYLDALWRRESGWNHLAENRSSGAYGIPQSLPGNKMAVVGSDWRTNPETQIRWGLAYIRARYGTPEGAWQHSERHGWY